MKIVVAMDSFKGCLTSEEANQAAAEGIRRVSPDADIVQVPVSDGGEGFLQAFHAAIGGEWQGVTVRDPLMRPVTAHYLLVDKFAHTRPEVKVAVIEMAQASGLTLLTKEERNPMELQFVAGSHFGNCNVSAAKITFPGCRNTDLYGRPADRRAPFCRIYCICRSGSAGNISIKFGLCSTLSIHKIKRIRNRAITADNCNIITIGP